MPFFEGVIRVGPSKSDADFVRIGMPAPFFVIDERQSPPRVRHDRRA